MSTDNNAGDGPPTQHGPRHQTNDATGADTSPSSTGHGSDVHPDANDKGEVSPKEDQHHDLRKRTTELKDKITDKKEKIKDKTKPDGGYDPTPLPDFPPGYTVKFTFHGATNLPAADIHNASADPYLTATLTAAVPKRHKEDPIMIHRTRTLRCTTEPDWEEEWIVANVPRSGFRLKCRLYDEDYPDHDDRLGNFTYETSHIGEDWKGPDHESFQVKKRMGSKRAYILKAATSALSKNTSMSPNLVLSISILGKSDPPGAQMHTVGPTTWIQHFSPMIGRLTGIKVNRDKQEDSAAPQEEKKDGEKGERKDGGKDEKVDEKKDDGKPKKYDFQANELQLKGPVPSELYHRYVEFRPVIGRMFTSSGLRGRVLNKALHHQHRRIYNFDNSTQRGTVEPCSREAAVQFLKMAHFDEGGRIFTYVLTLDGILRFTETGKEFGIDMLSKHTMHSDVATYIACSGEFFIRRLSKPTGDEEPEPAQATHPDEPIPGGPPHDSPPQDPAYYQLVIDNDSGTYRPDKSVLEHLRSFLERNFPGLGVVVMHWEDEELQKLKKDQREAKKKEGKMVNMVLNRSPTSSSFSSDDESRLSDLDIEDDDDAPKKKTKKEMAWAVLEDPNRIRGLKDSMSMGHKAATEPETAK